MNKDLQEIRRASFVFLTKDQLADEIRSLERGIAGLDVEVHRGLQKEYDSALSAARAELQRRK